LFHFRALFDQYFDFLGSLLPIIVIIGELFGHGRAFEILQPYHLNGEFLIGDKGKKAAPRLNETMFFAMGNVHKKRVKLYETTTTT
jgi:hypothetical protein